MALARFDVAHAAAGLQRASPLRAHLLRRLVHVACQGLRVRCQGRLLLRFRRGLRRMCAALNGPLQDAQRDDPWRASRHLVAPVAPPASPVPPSLRGDAAALPAPRQRLQILLRSGDRRPRLDPHRVEQAGRRPRFDHLDRLDRLVHDIDAVHFQLGHWRRLGAPAPPRPARPPHGLRQ
eukprot:5623754-Prymnesium_polylepis.1